MATEEMMVSWSQEPGSAEGHHLERVSVAWSAGSARRSPETIKVSVDSLQI